MDPTGLSLPCLLDLTASPSYSYPKISSNKRRPITTEPLANQIRSTTRLHHKRPKDSPSQTPIISKTPRMSYKLEAEVENEGSPSFCFSELRTAPRPLPRLYTANQYDAAVQKMSHLKDRYRRLYQNPNVHDGEKTLDIDEENLRDMILEAEKVFNKTYSVKYFGIKDDQLGIVSKRVPMAPEKPYKTARTSFYTKRDFSTGRKLNTEEGNEKSNGSVLTLRSSSESRLIRPHKPLEIPTKPPVLIKEEQKTTSRTKLDDIIEEVPEAKEGIDSAAKVRGAYVRGIPEIRGMPNYEEMDSLHQETKEGENLSSSPKNYENTNNAENNYVVTHYLVPRKLQTVKKTPEIGKVKGKLTPKLMPNERLKESRRSAQGVAGLMGDQEQDEVNKMWLKVTVADQQASNTADFERKVMSLEKTKRTLLRNVCVDKVWESKVPKDELDIPEKFRTYEVKKVMADSTKYSYSNLLKTMYTNERPETALVENTRKMERIVALRERKQKRLGLTSRKADGSLREIEKEHNGKYIVKVSYPQENEMFNTFIKIRSSVSPRKRNERR